MVFGTEGESCTQEATLKSCMALTNGCALLVTEHPRIGQISCQAISHGRLNPSTTRTSVVWPCPVMKCWRVIEPRSIAWALRTIALTNSWGTRTGAIQVSGRCVRRARSLNDQRRRCDSSSSCTSFLGACYFLPAIGGMNFVKLWKFPWGYSDERAVPFNAAQDPLLTL